MVATCGVSDEEIRDLVSEGRIAVGERRTTALLHGRAPMLGLPQPGPSGDWGWEVNP